MGCIIWKAVYRAAVTVQLNVLDLNLRIISSLILGIDLAFTPFLSTLIKCRMSKLFKNEYEELDPTVSALQISLRTLISRHSPFQILRCNIDLIEPVCAYFLTAYEAHARNMYVCLCTKQTDQRQPFFSNVSDTFNEILHKHDI